MNNNNLTKKQRRELRKQEKRQEQAQREKKSRLRRLLLWGGVTAGLIGIILLLAINAKNNPTPAENGNILPQSLSIAETDHTKGNPSSTTSLIEYSDFQCPACASYYPLIQRLTEELGDKLYFAYRHFPLPQHENASPAAEAAEAAGIQGKFWEMHDLLFENQATWASLSSKQAQEKFTEYAEKLALDVEQFQQDFKSNAVKEIVQKQYKGGLTAKVNATPTFFLNGKKISTPPNYEEFKKLIMETP